MTKAVFSPLVSRRVAPPAKTAAPARHPGAAAGLPRFLSTPAVVQRSSDRISPTVTVPHVRSVTPHRIQKASALQVSSPSDSAEIEAERVAHRVMRMPASETHTASSCTDKPSVTRVSDGTIARKATGASTLSGDVAAEIHASRGGGAPLPPLLRRFMEPRFGARFDNVRIHTGERAERLNRQVSAHAFTVGPDIFFGRGQYEPDNPAGRELIAHELTHTIQQGAVAQGGVIRRSADVEVSASTAPQIQRALSPREFIAEKAEAIPGWTMLTVVIGYNPISGQHVERNAGNILKGAIQIIPGGNFITDALNNHGVFEKASQWASQQFNALRDIAGSLRGAVGKVIDELKFSDILHPIEAWERSKRIFTDPIDRIKAFAINLKDGIVELIKDAILKPIAAFAKEKTNGYDLLCAIMGKDPISGEPAPENAEAFIGGFLKFIGENETWERIKQANAIPRIAAWFKSTMSELKRFVNEIPGLFVTAFKSLEIIDIVLIPRAFIKLATVFGGFAVKFISWGAGAVWKLLEIIFDVISPGALGYIKKTGAAIKSIFKNPLPFMGNLVQAGKLGFQNFAGNFLTHLKAGLIDWLTGSLPGIYIPTAFTLKEILKFVLSILGLSWANIRQKLVKVVGETAVKAMETGFDIVVTLVTQGPAAAWEKIKDQLSNLKDMVIGGITDFVVEMVVTKAVPKLVAMFIPGAGFISAIVTIYDTVMVFVNKISKIIQVVTGFINSIVAIAAGQIAAAASKVESTLAGLLSLAINFLAGFAGLGKVADKVMGVIQKIRAPIDKALDWLVNWIVGAARQLGRFVAQAGLPHDPNERLRLGLDAATAVVNALRGPALTAALINPVLTAIKIRYGFQSLRPVETGGVWWVEGTINPTGRKKTDKRSGSEDVATPARELTGGELLSRVLADLRKSRASASKGTLRAAVAELEQRYQSLGLRKIRIDHAPGVAPAIAITSESTAQIEGYLAINNVPLPDYGAVTATVSIDSAPYVHVWNGEGKDAEERIIPILLTKLKQMRQPPTTVELLVSQSPCREKCTPLLKKLKAAYPTTSFSLYYKTTHQSTGGKQTSDSIAALNALKRAGWNIAIWNKDGEIRSPELEWLR